MKRTNLVLDERLLDSARRISGSKTYSEAVNLALKELIRKRTFEKIDSFAGSGAWEGDLGEMRDDHGVSR